jgi:hypothetical protein
MPSTLKEFSSTFEQFRERFPKHPLVEEVRSRISRSTFPNDEWLKQRTRRMKDLMAPIWYLADER